RRAEFYGLRRLFAGSLCALLPLVLRDSLGWQSFVWAGVCLGAGALAGAGIGFFMKLPAGEAARLADRGYGLQDRISTALECAVRVGRRGARGRSVLARSEARCSRWPPRGRTCGGPRCSSAR